MRSRSRSRSPHHRRDRVASRSKDNRRHRSKDRDRRRDDRTRNRTRSRSRSPLPPRRRHSRSRSPPPRRPRSSSLTPPRRSRSHEKDAKKEKETLLSRPQISDADLVGKTDDEIEMMKLMGFASFDTSKGKHVSGNTGYAVNIVHKRKYRQYMNRKGGFNRPLDFVA